jgi:hypothetical protein
MKPAARGDRRARTHLALLAALPLTLLAAEPALAWGRTAHQLVVERATSALPKNLKDFYRAHRREMPTLSPDGEVSWVEGPERRFALDRFGPFPFRDLPRTEATTAARFADAARDAGRLPWLVQESYDKLVERYRARQREEILTEADRLAGLVADLHNPLAVTEDFDGQRAGQGGLWTRFAVRLPEALLGHMHLNLDVAHLIDDPHGFVFAIMRASYVWFDNVVYEEDLASRTSAGQSDLYYEAMGQRLKPLVQARLEQAARNVASYWYTAWVSAGKPSLETPR